MDSKDIIGKNESMGVSCSDFVPKILWFESLKL